MPRIGPYFTPLNVHSRPLETFHARVPIGDPMPLFDPVICHIYTDEAGYAAPSGSIATSSVKNVAPTFLEERQENHKRFLARMAAAYGHYKPEARSDRPMIQTS